MSKQTAVEWLFNEIDMQFPSINIRHKEWILDQSLQMEREQIEQAYFAGIDLGIMFKKYEQRYGKEASDEKQG